MPLFVYMKESLTDTSSLLARFCSEKGQVLLQLQTCIASLSNALAASGALDIETLAEITTFQNDCKDSETAAEILYTTVATKAESDPEVMVKFVDSADKVAPGIVDLLKPTRIALTFELLRSKRDVFVKELDVDIIMDACINAEIITESQYKALAKARQMGKPKEFMADRFLRVVENQEERERASKLKSLGRILLAKQRQIMTEVLEPGQSNIWLFLVELL